jgi:hypothetical protein
MLLSTKKYIHICAVTRQVSWVALVLAMAATPLQLSATSCTTQAELVAADRDALASAGGRLTAAVAQQDFAALQSALLPSVAPNWERIRSTAESAGPLLKGGKIQIRSLYLLDAGSLTAPADTQFFCSNANGSLTVTVTMRLLPPGRYALVLADASGAPLGGQLGVILAWQADGQNAGWKLGGLTARQGILDGHDGVWWWSHARDQAKANFSPWSAWFSYKVARELLVPVDFLSSPNLEKLATEQSEIKGSPQNLFPYTVVDGPRTWKIDAVRLDLSLRQADLGVAYESNGITDPAAQRTEAVAVLTAILKAQPGLRNNFHGLWAYAVKDGKWTPIMELPMGQIP